MQRGRNMTGKKVMGGRKNKHEENDEVEQSAGGSWVTVIQWPRLNSPAHSVACFHTATAKHLSHSSLSSHYYCLFSYSPFLFHLFPKSPLQETTNFYLQSIHVPKINKQRIKDILQSAPCFLLGWDVKASYFYRTQEETLVTETSSVLNHNHLKLSLPAPKDNVKKES